MADFVPALQRSASPQCYAPQMIEDKCIRTSSSSFANSTFWYLQSDNFCSFALALSKKSSSLGWLCSVLGSNRSFFAVLGSSFLLKKRNVSEFSFKYPNFAKLLCRIFHMCLKCIRTFRAFHLLREVSSKNSWQCEIVYRLFFLKFSFAFEDFLIPLEPWVLWFVWRFCFCGTVEVLDNFNVFF